MAQVTIAAETRLKTGKGSARRARRDGVVPGIIYGWETKPKTLSIDESSLERFLNSPASGGLVEVRVGEEKHTVLVKEIQRDPVRGHLLHVDFHKVRLDQEVQTLVPITVVGEEQRVSDGGILALSIHELPISCLPTHIPDAISVDVSSLAMGDTLTVADLELPEGVTTDEDLQSPIVSVVAPEEEVEEPVEDEEEAAEEAAEEEVDSEDEEE